MYYPVPEISFKDGVWLTVTKMRTSPQEIGLVYPEFDFENLMNF